MSDDAPHAVPDALPLPSAPAPAFEPPPPAPEPAADRTRPLLVAVVVLALVVLVGGYLLWHGSSDTGDQVGQLKGQLAALQTRLAQVEARPAPPSPPPPADLRPIEQRLAALEQKPGTGAELAPLAQRLTALEQKPPPQAQLDPAGEQQIAAVSSRIDGVAARQNQLGVTEQDDVAKLAAQITQLDGRMDAVTKAGSAIAALADRQARTARLQTASVALQSGKPLGTIPGAPPALARYATQPPPTEASLRLSFDAAADAAHEAGQPAKEDAPLLTRMWDRAQSGFTVRQGDKIIMGDAVAGVLAQARHFLDAGDLPGAVGALDGLSGRAAAAMAPWRAQAQSVLDARAALISAANG